MAHTQSEDSRVSRLMATKHAESPLHSLIPKDGNSYPVQYYSRTLRKYERNYTITELECLAIIETVDRFKVYLAGNCFTIFTDHCALQWLKNIKNPTGRLFRCSLRLSVYDYLVKYIKGTKQLEADLLSGNLFCGLLDATQLKMYQSELRDNPKYVHQISGLTTVTRRGVSKIVVPPSLRPTILREDHQKFNHPGISQLTRIISAQYFWSGMSIDIRAFVKNCNICQMSKTPKGPKYGELGELPESPLPFDLVSMDTIAGFSRYGSAKNYLHVVVDHATRFAWTFPSRSTSTTTYIQVIKKVLQSGCPKRLLTDRAPAFTSPRFTRFLISHNIQPMLTTSNHPQANGLSERLNATLTGKLRLLHLQHPRVSWTMLQSKVVKAYNDTPHSVTGFPPSYLMDGSLPKELSQHLDPYSSVTESRRLALQRTKERHKLDKIRFDKNHRFPDFEVGDLVLTKIYQHPNTGKLVPYFSGPYEIIEVISPYTVRINRPNQAQNLDTEIIHVNKLKHYSEDTKYIFTPHSMNNNSTPKSYFIYHHFPPEIFHDDYKNFASTLSNPFNHMNPDIFLDNDEPTLTARYISTPDTIPKIDIQLEPSPTTNIMLPSSPTRNHTPQIIPQLSALLINCDNAKLENRSFISKNTGTLIEKTEKALVIWIEDLTQKRIPLDGHLIKMKALKFYKELKESEASTSSRESNPQFSASTGWLTGFIKRHSFHNLKIKGEVASADEEAARKYPEKLAKIIKDGGYCAHQIFNADETGLFWKKMPTRTYIAKSEKNASGFKAAKDRVTLLLCSNASGDRMLKPLLVNRSLKPRALKGKDSNTLPVHWMANKKAWVTTAIFTEWFNKCFVPEVENYMKEMGLEFKILLILDNAPGHPNLEHPNIKVVFFPPNTTSLIQPLDQGIISTFKKYYVKFTFQFIFDKLESDTITVTEVWKQFNILNCVDHVALAIAEIKSQTLNACWKAAWPECVSKRNESNRTTIVTSDIISIAKEIGGEGFDDFGEHDIKELLVDEALNDDDILESMVDTTKDFETVDSEQEDVTPLDEKLLREGLQLSEKLEIFFIQNDNDVERALKFQRDLKFCMSGYRELYKELVKPSQRLITDYLVKEKKNH
ncbi:hypothetical protein LAZ67_6001509 [Cordylochernes scorpioides]|uniref:RNA-directed DNA polymerase n=1 Tax=Cordylochernes scorpioides TaxID=51811 RepID=A0ABY6KJ83_9ARAC|nr:hypothetical protein LAZ67_6001509 [Cordylochernes scorpioides]